MPHSCPDHLCTCLIWKCCSKLGSWRRNCCSSCSDLKASSRGHLRNLGLGRVRSISNHFRRLRSFFLSNPGIGGKPSCLRLSHTFASLHSRYSEKSLLWFFQTLSWPESECQKYCHIFCEKSGLKIYVRRLSREVRFFGGFQDFLSRILSLSTSFPSLLW